MADRRRFIGVLHVVFERFQRIAGERIVDTRIVFRSTECRRTFLAR